MKEIFLGHLAKTLNRPAEEIAELLYQKGEDGSLTDEMVENAAELLSEWDVERVRTLRSTTDNKKALDDQYKRGQKEALTAQEKALRSKYGIDSDKTGVDLVDEIVAAVSKSDLPEDKVKRHPLYLSLEKQAAEKVAQLQAQHEAERAEIEKDFTRKFTLSDVKRLALTELDKLNPILPENPTIAANYKRLFADALEQYGFEKQDGGQYLVLKGDTRYEDAHGHPVSFEKLVSQTAAEFFQFHQQDAKGSAANKNGATAGAGTFTLPKTMAEAWQMTRNAKTSEERQAILAAAEGLE